MAGSGSVKSKSGKSYKASSTQGKAIQAGNRNRQANRVSRASRSVGVERSVAGARMRLM